MLGWNKITQLTSKAGGAVSKVKDFAKDLITVDTEENENQTNNVNQDFQSAFAQLQKGYGLAQSPKENSKKANDSSSRSPIESTSPIQIEKKIEMQEIKRPEIDNSSLVEIKEFIQQTFASISQTINTSLSVSEELQESKEGINPDIQTDQQEQTQEQPEINKQDINNNDQTNLVTLKDKLNEIFKNASNQLDTQIQQIQNNFQESITKLNDQLSIEQQSIGDIGALINQFFISISRQSTFYDRFNQLRQQKGQSKEIVSLIEKSLTNTGTEILQSKQDQQQSKKEQQLINDNANLQKKIVEMQEKTNNTNSQIKDLQNRIKELEKYQQEWDKIKRDYAEEIKQNFNESENLRAKLKQKEQELSQSNQDLQRMQDLRILLEQKQEEIDRLEKLLEEWQLENQSLQSGIQAAQLQLEAEKDQKEKIIKKFQEEFKKLRSEISKEDISQLKFLKENNEKLKLSNSQLKLQVEELTIKHESLLRSHEDLKSEAQALHNKIRQDQNYVNNMVDKRVITNVLIQYFDFNSDFKVKVQILETLASLLDLTRDEKEKINPYRNKQNQAQGQQQSSSFRDKFIGFLKQGD
ncbi:unnamed protein product [Paramecium octaurelia]|uniref:GRIP domain-containing protein n=1 Tax=Paramecium octaurelia TaxID=43137 RepID=A0A8S1VM80_PAROT|nr:unnamed protein product [Paramecium octaurelia]